jgi:hypothetical protein
VNDRFTLEPDGAAEGADADREAAVERSAGVQH